MAALKEAIIFLRLVLLLLNLYPAIGKCPKHEALLHNFKPTYFLDKGETLKAWAKLIPEPWEDNRLIGSLSNTEYLTFNLTSLETSSELQAIGVISRNVTVSIGEKEKHSRNKEYNYTRLSEMASDVLFRIEAFFEEQACVTLKAETNVTVGCPLSRHIIPRGKPISCDSFRNYSFVIPRYQQKGVFLATGEVSDKTVEYDLVKLGCPFPVQSNEPFKPIVDLYDGETFVKEVDVNYVMWEQHGRKGYKYSATMKEAGCITEAQNWEKMIKTVEAESMESAWSKENYQSCFQEYLNGSMFAVNLDQPYEIFNSSAAASHIVWDDVGTFVFMLKVIDPDFSFCNLTVEFGVQVRGVRSMMEEIPTFVVLGSSCLTIIILLLSAYYTAVLCSN
ncbi:cation channel sperm-associated auxiliary subunit epsilon-like [Oculina patagonica]